MQYTVSEPGKCYGRRLRKSNYFVANVVRTVYSTGRRRTPRPTPWALGRGARRRWRWRRKTKTKTKKEKETPSYLVVVSRPLQVIPQTSTKRAFQYSSHYRYYKLEKFTPIGLRPSKTFLIGVSLTLPPIEFFKVGPHYIPKSYLICGANYEILCQKVTKKTKSQVYISVMSTLYFVQSQWEQEVTSQNPRGPAM